MIRLNGVDHDSTINSVSQVSHGAYVLADNPNLYEIQRTNNFEIRFPNLNQLTSSQTMSKDNKVVYNDCGKAITLSVASVGDLSQSISAIPVSYGNNAVKFAGKPELNSISITINDFIGLETERILESWSALVYNKYDQTVGKASKYKQRAYLIEYSPDYEIAQVWQLEGCWPGDISYAGYINIIFCLK